MAGYTKLFSSILHSTIWQEQNEIKVLWITMLAMADKDGIVAAAIPGLAKMAGISIACTEEGLNKFMSPDKFSRTPDHEGRRIEVADGGWRLLNYPKYRRLMSAEERREYERTKKATYRARQKSTQCPGQVQDMSLPMKPIGESVHQAEAEAEAEAVKTTAPHQEQKKRRKPAAPTLPAELDTPEFKAAWQHFEQHRKEKRRPITPLSSEQIFKDCVVWGVEKSIRALLLSIKCGWQGVFDPDNRGYSNGASQPGPRKKTMQEVQDDHATRQAWEDLYKSDPEEYYRQKNGEAVPT